MFTEDANCLPSIMVGDVCGGKQIDLKTVAFRNVLLCVITDYVGSPMIVLLTCTPSLKKISQGSTIEMRPIRHV